MWTKDLINDLIKGVEDLPERLAALLANPPVNPALQNLRTSAPAAGAKPGDATTSAAEQFKRSVDQLTPSIDKLAKQAREAFASGQSSPSVEAQRREELARAAKMTRETAQAMRDWKPFLREWPHLRGTVEQHVANQVREQMTGGTWKSLGFGLLQLPKPPPSPPVWTRILPQVMPLLSQPRQQAMLEGPPAQQRLRAPEIPVWARLPPPPRVQAQLTGPQPRLLLTDQRPEWAKRPEVIHGWGPTANVYGPQTPPRRPTMRSWRRWRVPPLSTAIKQSLWKGIGQGLGPAGRRAYQQAAQQRGRSFVGLGRAIGAVGGALNPRLVLAIADMAKFGTVAMAASTATAALVKRLTVANFESQRYLSPYSSGIAQAFGEYDIREVQRNMRVGQQRSESLKRLSRSVSGLKDALEESGVWDTLNEAGSTLAIGAQPLAKLALAAANLGIKTTMNLYRFATPMGLLGEAVYGGSPSSRYTAEELSDPNLEDNRRRVQRYYDSMSWWEQTKFVLRDKWGDRSTNEQQANEVKDWEKSHQQPMGPWSQFIQDVANARPLRPPRDTDFAGAGGDY